MIGVGSMIATGTRNLGERTTDVLGERRGVQERVNLSQGIKVIRDVIKAHGLFPTPQSTKNRVSREDLTHIADVDLA
jgi:hypothetical protein